MPPKSIEPENIQAILESLLGTQSFEMKFNDSLLQTTQHIGDKEVRWISELYELKQLGVPDLDRLLLKHCITLKGLAPNIAEKGLMGVTGNLLSQASSSKDNSVNINLGKQEQTQDENSKQ